MPKIDRMLVGESLVGDGNEVAHIDLIIGPRGTPAEAAFANALTNNKDGFTSLLAVVAPNLLTKPATVMFNKVTIKGAKQAVQMFGPAQRGVGVDIFRGKIDYWRWFHSGSIINLNRLWFTGICGVGMRQLPSQENR